MATSSRTRSNKEGFTLTELIVVIGLIALMSVLALPSVMSVFKMSLQTASRELATTIKESYNSAVMTGRIYRIVYDFKSQSFWVESGPNTVLLDTDESREKEERRQRFAKAGEKLPPSEFSQDKTVTRSKVTLPRGVVFEDIVTEASKEPITAGKAYTHFFPHGFTEQTLIHLKDDSDHKVTLIVSSLVGYTRMVEDYVSMEDFND